MTSITRRVAAKTNLFSLSVQPGNHSVELRLVLNTPYINTRQLPRTYDILEDELPEVLETECFNDKGLVFSEEVLETEIGHLFEHILLAYLCLEKTECGFKNATYGGRTCWDWKSDIKGSFNISVFASLEDYPLVLKALSRTINLTDHILKSNLPKSAPAVTRASFNFLG